MSVLVTGGLGAIGFFATRYLIETGETPVVRVVFASIQGVCSYER